MWERHPEAMGAALRLHDGIMRRVHRGARRACLQDGGRCLLRRVSDALGGRRGGSRRAAGLQREDWPPPGRLHVRMALHTGRAEERDGDYYGRPLNRCARIEGLAHGDQVLLSEDAAAASVRPPAAGRRHRGHGQPPAARPHPARAHLPARHPELPDAFPPLRSLDARPNNLPVRRPASWAASGSCWPGQGPTAADAPPDPEGRRRAGQDQPGAPGGGGSARRLPGRGLVRRPRAAEPSPSWWRRATAAALGCARRPGRA